MTGAERGPKAGMAVAIVVGLVTCGACGGALVWVGSRAQHALANALGGDDSWSEGVLSRLEVEQEFGLKLPAGVYSIHSRSMGFQDPYRDVLIPLADRAAFEKANGFIEGPSTEELSAADEQVRAIAHPKGALRAVDLVGLTDLISPDGGFVEWYRHGSLLVYDDQVWLYLVAYGT